MLLLNITVAQHLFELAELRRMIRRDWVFRDWTNPLDACNDESQFKHYRFLREGIRYFCDLIDEDIRRPTQKKACNAPGT